MNEKCPSQINKLILMDVSCDSTVHILNVWELKSNKQPCWMFIKTWKNNEININKATMSLIIMFCFVKNVLMCCDWFGDDRSHTRHKPHQVKPKKERKNKNAHAVRFENGVTVLIKHSVRLSRLIGIKCVEHPSPCSSIAFFFTLLNYHMADFFF